MTRQVLYVAHPVRPTEEEIRAFSYRIERGRAEYIPDFALPQTRGQSIADAIKANIDRALRWLAWLRTSFPETTFIAPWIADLMSGADDGDPAQREAGMRNNFDVIERCDGIVLCGGRISEGMRRETEHGQMRYKIWFDPADRMLGFAVYGLTGYQIEGASGRNEDRRTFAEWMRGYQESCTR
jgi:hypothetical protein